MKNIIPFIALIILPSILFAKSPKREMRGVWIATVANIDWPSRSGLSVAKQKEELIALLDRHKENGMNTVIFQIRPATDAFYRSSYEPWSIWLTGVQGEAPDPFYDPLQFAIEECHKRAMELHAWMNPYRAVFLYESAKTDPDHITNRLPDLFLNYGKHKYFNPGFQATRDYVSKIVGDVVRRYDLDAIHFDDYFYPYKIAGTLFPDSLCFANNGGEFYPDKLEDWRRDNVNKVIRQINDTIKSIKPWMPFGISPFGVWRNDNVDDAGSKTRAGQTNYDDLYADVLLWLKNDWIDYVAPQVYWHIGKKVADYRVLAKWWRKNSYGKPCYIGHSVYKLDVKSKDREWRKAKQIVRQVKMNRRLDGIDGSMFFRSCDFMNNRLDINKTLKKETFNIPAMNLVNPLFNGKRPEAPQLKSNGSVLSWNPVDHASYYAVYQSFGLMGRKKLYRIISSCEIHVPGKTSKYVVSAVNRGHVESKKSKKCRQ